MRLFLAFLAVMMVASVMAESQKNKQKELKKQIDNTTVTLQQARSTSEKLRKDVVTAEKNLSKISRQLYSTEKKINQLATRLNQSNARKKKLLQNTEEQKSALAQQMQALYTSGKQSPLRLLLKQDDPSEISRTIKYFEYMNQHRLKRIRSINNRLDKIKKVQQQINEDSTVLTELQSEQAQKKKALKRAVSKREKILKKQRKTVYTHEQILKRLKQKEARLKSVIARLAAKQVREKKERKKRELQAKKQREKEPASKRVKRSVAKGPETRQHYVPDKPFSSLKGRLSWPVSGHITQHFGSVRNIKQNWKGVIISAPGGSMVHAVARGKVEFSGRLNGYGYLIIIRHDKNYRSLYAYNRSVYKREGQIVKAGEIIAAVGNSGGRSQNGLYFEIRKGTAYRNPAHWCR